MSILHRAPARFALPSQAIFLVIVLAAVAAACGGGQAPLPSTTQITQQLSSTTQSAHYNFHMSPGDSVDTQRQEAYHAWIAGQLGINPSRTVEYYKYRDAAQKQAITGRAGNAFADNATFSIHTIWNWDNHEVTHLLTTMNGLPPSLFTEGIAVAYQMDPQAGDFVAKWSSVPIHTRAKSFMQQGTLPSLDIIVESIPFSNVDPNITYPSAGSFVRYLIDRDGLAKMLQMFPGATHQEPKSTTLARFQQIYNESLTQAEQEWHTFLLQLP